MRLDDCLLGYVELKKIVAEMHLVCEDRRTGEDDHLVGIGEILTSLPTCFGTRWLLVSVHRLRFLLGLEIHVRWFDG